MATSEPTPATTTPAPDHEAALRQRLDEHPEDLDSLVGLAMLCADEGRFTEARDLMERAVALRGDDVQLRLSAAGMAANDGDVDAAERHYREALLLRQGLPPAHVGLGRIAQHRKQPSVAEEHFATALKLAPEDSDAQLGMADLLLDQGRIEAAVQAFAQLVQANPRHALGLTGYGQALMQRGTPEQAVRPLKRALEIDASLQRARLLLGHVELYRGNVGPAEKAYRDVLQAQPSNGDALAGLGDALRAQNRHDEAFLAYDAARRVHPDAEVLTVLRATSLGALGRHAEAVADLEAFVAAHPRCAAPRLLLADIYRESGKADLAAAMWQQAADKDADDALAWSELAFGHEQRGEFAEAAAAALNGSADDRVGARLMRARVALRQENADTAQRELMALKGARLAPGEKRDRLRLLGLVHDRAGRWAEAVLAFREAHRIDAAALPELAAAELLQPVMEPLLAEPELLHPRVAPPVLLLGLPGSRIEHVAALLADQAAITLREDRFAGQVDFLANPREPMLLTPLPQSRLGVLARRYARGQDRHARRDANGVVDWIPCFDARLLPALKLALPGVRVVVVDSDPQLAYLRWLALGWQRRLRIRDNGEAARWFQLARQQLDMAAQYLPSLRVDADALLADPAAQGGELASFLGLDELRPGRLSTVRRRPGTGLADRFTPGYEQHYRGVLGEAFRLLG